MSQYLNSSARVSHIFSQILQADNNKNMNDLWCDIFLIKEKDRQKKTFEIYRCIELLHDEITSIDVSMDKTNFSEELYKPYIQKALTLLTPNSANGDCQGYQNILKPEVILSFKFCQEILPQEEEELNNNEINEALKLIEELEEELKSKNLPDSLKDVILKNITEIKRAIHNFNIIGIKAFYEMIENTSGKMVMNREKFEKEKDNEQVSKFKKIWVNIYTISKRVETFGETLNKYNNLFEGGQKFLENIGVSQ